MKKIFFIFLLLANNLLFAEGSLSSNYPSGDIFLETGSTFFLKKSFMIDEQSELLSGEIIAIIPYEKGYILKLINEEKNVIHEIYL